MSSLFFSKLLQAVIVLVTVCICVYWIKFDYDIRQKFIKVQQTIHISHDIFNCSTWQNLSYLKKNRFEACLHWNPDSFFWNVMNIRHTAYKNLLNQSSLIIEVGGNIGDDTKEFIRLYNPWIISFEPLDENYNILRRKFGNNSKYELRHYGVGNQRRHLAVQLHDSNNAGTSMFRPVKSNSTRVQIIDVRNIVEEIREIQKTRTKDGMIDLLSVNCEGCEFEVVPALIVNKMMQYFRHIQFATHVGLVPDTLCIYCQIQQSLEQTHSIIFHYEVLWEGWKLKDKNTTINTLSSVST